MSDTIYFSRFPDAVTPGADPLVPVPELVTIHAHALAGGRALVLTWAWDDGAKDYTQRAVIDAESVEAARDYVPAGLQRVPVPEEFAVEAWTVPVREVA